MSKNRVVLNVIMKNVPNRYCMTKLTEICIISMPLVLNLNHLTLCLAFKS